MVEETAEIKDKKPESSPLPDVGDLLFIGVMYILLFGRPHFLFQDASIGWHLQAGKYIWQSHSIPYTDLFSYTFPDKAWVAYEWLFDLIAYALTQAGGYNLLAVAVSGTIAFVLMKMYDRAREYGAPLALATFASIIGILASAVHWLARPHIITFLAVSYFVAILESFNKDEIKPGKMIGLLALIMVLWVNCHPAFLLGIALCGIYFGINLLLYVKDRGLETASKYLERTKVFFAAGFAVSMATLLNPYGWNLHIYIFKYLRGSSILENTDEFLSPVFHDDIHALCLEILFFLLIVGAAVSKKKLSAPYLIVVLMFLHLSLSAVRNIPLFALISVPAIGLLFSEHSIFDRIRALPANLQDKLRPFAEFDAQELLSKRRFLSLAYFSTMVIAALCGGSFMGIVNLNSGFDKTKVPTKTLSFIKKEHLNPDRGFNYDNWGGLLRYQLDQRVFIDDRADFYGEEFYNQYGVIVQTRPGWRKLLEKHGIEWVLMPSDTKLALALKKESGWRLACQDAASCLYLKTKVPSQGQPKTE